MALKIIKQIIETIKFAVNATTKSITAPDTKPMVMNTLCSCISNQILIYLKKNM